MKMSKVGNQTNSQDPQAINSRVFVGNLNTFQCTKTDVECMFQRYGRIAGISMHKGYAFVQFTNPFDARSACLGEDGRTVLGQTLDVNMVAEPKPHQTGRKRQNLAKTGNDWDYYYDSYYASASFAPGPHRWVPPLKRARLMVPPGPGPGPGPATRPLVKTPPPLKPPGVGLAQLKTYSTPDILICGNCREMFSELQELVEHKKSYCKLRFTCKCHTFNGVKPKSPGEEPAALLCVLCKDSFTSAWDLMVHVQAAHMLNIYELGVPKLQDDDDEKEGKAMDEMEGEMEMESTGSLKDESMSDRLGLSLGLSLSGSDSAESSASIDVDSKKDDSDKKDSDKAEIFVHPPQDTTHNGLRDEQDQTDEISIIATAEDRSTLVASSAPVTPPVTLLSNGEVLQVGPQE